MSLSMYRITVPVYSRALSNLDFALGQGAAFAAQTGRAEAELMERRLAPDMFTLAQQIQQACFHARIGTANLAGAEAPPLPEQPARSIDEARERIADTLAFLESLAPDALEGDLDRPIEFRVRFGELSAPAFDYVTQYVQPQIYFHVTTAYDILRAEGVQIGKIDFLGAILKDKFGNP